MRWGLIGVAAALGLSGCSQPASNGAAPTNAPPASMAAVAAAAPPAANATAASAPAGPSFKIAVTLTPAASRQLAGLGQDVIVSADFYGQANGQAPAHMADEMDQISLANEVRVTLPGAGGGTVIQVPALDQSKMAYIQGGDPQLLINVFSGQNLSPDNKLDCGLFEDRLALAEQAGIQISCKLIGES